MLKICSFIKFHNPILFNTDLPKLDKIFIPRQQVQSKDMMDHTKTLMVNKTCFNKVTDKEEVVIMVQNVQESLFYSPELMPKLMTLKLYYVPQHFSS